MRLDRSSDLNVLFKPARIGAVSVRNRLVFQPHFTALGSAEGMPSKEHAAYHEERARGGVGLIIFESQAIHPTGKMAQRFVHAWDAAVVPFYREIAERVHAHGTRIFGQLTHGGHTSLMHPPPIMWAPSQMSEPSSFHNTKAMDRADIEATIAGFAAAARNARDGGFDGVEIKVAHDGLLRSFASPFFNRRTDEYGGSFENRMRLSVEVLAAIKEVAGADFPVGVRLCLNEYTDWGYGTDYGLQMAAHLEATGMVDYFNCDAGSFSSFWMEIPPAAVAEGTFRGLNAALKRSSSLPIIAFGRIKPMSLAAEILKAGEADFIGLGRQLISDPETPNKLREGRAEEVRLCIACNDACVYQVNQGNGVRCIHNPDAGNETRHTIRTLPVASPAKAIAVVGGGVAGLKFAETAARRGHKVTLFERTSRLGGQVLLAARQPHHAEIGDVARHLESEARRLKVDIRLETTPSAAALLDFGADLIIVATGSEPNLPAAGQARSRSHADRLGRAIPLQIPGLDSDRVFSGDQVLAGNLPLGRRVLVVDGNGHWEAAGTVEYLLEAGFEVEAITPAASLGTNLEGANHALLHQRLSKLGARVSNYTRLRSIDGTGVVVEDVWGGSQRHLEADAVVAVMSRRSSDDLYLDLAEAARPIEINVERIGDCVAPRMVHAIIQEAYALARAI